MRYQVPQFIDVEDKVIGPFTIKQFLIYLMAVLFLIPVFLLSDLALFITIAIPVIVAAAAVAHLKINGKSVFATAANLLGYMSRGQMYVWRREKSNKNMSIQGGMMDSNVASTPTGSLSQEAQNLDTGGSVVGEDLDDPLGGEVK